MKNLVSASLLSANKENIVNDVERLIPSGVDVVHFDVMDGEFVPNISFLDDTFIKTRNHTSLVYEIHLMVKDPLNYLDKYDYSNEDVIIFHYESFENDEQRMRCINEIKKKHRVGISIKPMTDVSVLDKFLPYLDYILIMSVEPGFGGQKFISSALDKIEYLSKIKNNYHYVIEVDGGINDQTGPQCVECGCDILVSGSYLFKGDMQEKVRSLK